MRKRVPFESLVRFLNVLLGRKDDKWFTVFFVNHDTRLRDIRSLGLMVFSVLLLGFSSLTVTSSIAAEMDVGRTVRILYINSYQRGYSWSDDIEESLFQGLQAFSGKVELSIEYLDSRRFTLAGRTELLADQIKAKYADYPFDLVITSDNAAFDFVVPLRERLFPGVPVVFCGYNSLRPSVLEGMSNITGVNEEVDFSGSIDLALSIHPDVRTLAFVVSTNNESAMRNYETLTKDIFPRYRDKFELVPLKDLSLKEIQHQLNQLPDNSLLFVTGEASDITKGRPLSPVESVHKVSSVSPIPAYGFWEFQLDTGVLGGSMLTGTDQGRSAAEMAVKILGGTKAKDISIIYQSPVSFIFDYRVMEKFRLTENRMPAGSTIINKPESVWNEYRLEIISIVVLLVGESLLIGLLLHIARGRRRALAELASSEDRLKRTQAFGHVGSWVWNPNTGELYWSDETYRIFGYSPDEAAPSYEMFIERVQHEDRKLVSNAVDKALQEKSLYNIDFRIITVDGLERVVNARGEVSSDTGASPVLLLGTIQDITERKQAEKDIRESEEKYRSLMQNARDAIFIAEGESGILIDANRRAEELIGLSRENIIGMHQSQLHPEAEAETGRYRKLFRDCIESGNGMVSEHMEKYVQHSDGSKIPVEISAGVTEVGGKKLVQGIFHDITRRKQAEETLQKSKEKYRQLVEGLKEEYFFYAHGVDGVFTYISPSVRNVLGYPPEEYIIHYKNTITDNPINQMAIEKSAASIQGKRQSTYEVEVRRKDNSICRLAVTETPVFNKAGEVVAVDGIAHDITEQKRAEEAIEKAYDEMEHKVKERTRELAGANTKLKELDKVKSMFIASMSHELRTPLNSIIGFTGVILRGMAGDINNKQRDHLERVRRAGLPARCAAVPSTVFTIQSWLSKRSRTLKNSCSYQ